MITFLLVRNKPVINVYSIFTRMALGANSLRITCHKRLIDLDFNKSLDNKYCDILCVNTMVSTFIAV